MPRFSSYEYYVAQQSDTYDLIAYDLYGDEFRASDIVSLNPEHAGTVVFDGGEVLKVPVYDAEPAADGAAPWRRSE